MKNMNDCNKNNNESAFPDHLDSKRSVQGKSKHRIIHYDWTIYMIRAFIVCLIEVLFVKLFKNPVAFLKKTSITKKLMALFRRSAYFIKKDTNTKKSVFLLEIFLFIFFTNAEYPYTGSQTRNTGKLKFHHKEETISRCFTQILSKESVSITSLVN